MSKPLNESHNKLADAQISLLEAKLDALIAYTRNLEQSEIKLAAQSNLWRQRYEESMQQQIKTRERLEQVVKHLKNLEAPAQS